MKEPQVMRNLRIHEFDHPRPLRFRKGVIVEVMAVAGDWIRACDENGRIVIDYKRHFNKLPKEPERCPTCGHVKSKP